MVDPSETSRLGELARYVRQRMELGVDRWILEGLSVEDVARSVDAARAAPSSGAGPSSGAASSVGAGAPSRISRPSSAAPARASVAAAAPEEASTPIAGGTELPDDYDELRREALGCTRCRLCQEREQVVFSDGNRDARVMVVGEAPGANEDRTGVPFVGAAGKLLDLLLATVDLSRRDSVYICNVIKCRPPQNRNPRPDEIESCAPYLHRQIERVRPEAILAVGTFAGKLLTGQDGTLGRLRGEVHSYRGTPLVVTYHPAALLRNSGWTRPTWEDLQLLRGILDGS